MHTIIFSCLPLHYQYITWEPIWDLKTKKHRDPKIEKEILIYTHIYKKEFIYHIK